MDFRLSLNVAKRIKVKGYFPELDAPRDSSNWSIYCGQLGSGGSRRGEYGGSSVDFGVVCDTIRQLGEQRVRLEQPGAWRLDLNRHDHEQAAAFRLVRAESRPKFLNNPKDDYDAGCPHPGGRECRLRDGVSPNLQRKARGDIGFAMPHPIVRRSMLEPLEPFGVVQGVPVLVRGEATEWFTVELDATSIINIEESAGPKGPCAVGERFGNKHWLRHHIGMLTALPELSDNFGWTYEQHGWGCMDYERWVIVDRDAYEFLHHSGHKRAGEFGFEPIYAAKSEFAEMARELGTCLEQHLGAKGR